MDFFERQDASHRATRWLVLMFGLAFLAVGLATGIVVMIALGVSGNDPGAAFSEPEVLIVTVAVVVGLMVIASLSRVAILSQGGGHVARMLGGTRIQSDDQDLAHRRLLNVVEEMAIASGLPVPEVYVLEQEAGINAFAAGLTPGDAAVAVTRGSLERLNRAELQGVIAHEFSHILNGDMRLNLRLMGFGFGILVLALLGRSMLRASGTGMRMRVSRRGKGAGGILMVALALVVIGGIGVVLSRLIKAAVSRQREVLADASAVQFTREPMALAGALKKIGGFSPYIEHAETEEVSHMLFGRAGKSFTGLFATHPPLPDRIRALDPSFEPGDYIASEPGLSAETPGEAAGISRFQGGGEITIESAGTIEPEAGSALRAAIPADILDVAHSSQSAWLLVLALGLERGGGSAAEQRILENQIGADRTGRCLALHRQIETLDAGLRLPLFELAVPALKARPPEEIEYLFELLEKLAAADGELSLFEYLLQRLLRTYLFPLETHRSSATKIRAAELVLIGVLAVEGHEDATRARTAFSAGISALNIPAGPETEAAFDRALGARDFDALDQALTDLTGAGARERRSALVALVATLRHDQRTTLAEAELFRTIAATLGCPVPPGGVTG